MNPNIKPSEPLSHVTFVHDYLQLGFQDDGYTIHNSIELHFNGKQMRHNEPGFCDAIVGLIGQRVINAYSEQVVPLRLDFEHGASLVVLADTEGLRGPESWMFDSPGKPPVVQQNV